MPRRYGSYEFSSCGLARGDAASRWRRDLNSRSGVLPKIVIQRSRSQTRTLVDSNPLIASTGAGRIVYVSCHPGSLARDAQLLVHEHGYALKAAGIIDMFPHTAHVESLALFERR